jgi:outer membrane protein OmpA-like peptidoglycan-associated protein
MLDFEQDSYEILPVMTKDLDNVLNFLIDHPTYRIKISGHTDLTGDSAANVKLSTNRALAIKTYLTQNGVVTPDRIDATGFGSQLPIVPVERSEQDRRTNRRVEFQILYPEKKP